MKYLLFLRPSLLIIPLLLINTRFLQAQIHDFEYKEVRNYEIEEGNSSYKLYSDVKVTNTYQSRSALEKKIYFISEAYYDKITNIYGYKNRYRVSSSNIGFNHPPDKDVFITDEKIHYIKFDDLKEGDLIEYHYKNELKDVGFAPVISIPNIDYVQLFKIEIEHPEEIYIDFDFYFPHGKTEYTITREEDNTVLEFDSLKKSPDLEFSPFNNIQAFILMVIKKDSTPVNGTSVNGFVNWYSKLANINPVLPVKYKSFFDSLLAGEKDTDNRLRIIDDYVRQNIRYVADERGYYTIVPRQPEEVLNRKYGDCKDRAFLVSAIARAYNIHVNPVLVSTEFRPEFTSVNSGLFNHVLCVYNDGKKDIYFDPTAKYFEFKLLPEQLLNKKTLILDSLNPRISYIKPEGIKPEIDIEIKARLDSLETGVASITLKNQLYAHAIHAIKELTENQVDEFLSMVLKANFRELVFDHFIMTDSSETTVNSLVVFNSSVDLSKFIISTPSNKYLSKTPFLLYDNRILDRERDSLAVYTDYLSILKLKIELSDSSFEMKPDSLTLENKVAGIKFNAKSESKKSGEFTFNYSFYPSENYLTDDKKNGLIDFCRSYFNNKKHMFLIKGKKL
jgi:hypothetical protein